jgi:hypothetical protein
LICTPIFASSGKQQFHRRSSIINVWFAFASPDLTIFHDLHTLYPAQLVPWIFLKISKSLAFYIDIGETKKWQADAYRSGKKNKTWHWRVMKQPKQ